MMTIKLLAITGSFAENKDTARNLRMSKIIPSLKKGENIVIDFAGVEGTTQSFIHALVSDLMRQNGPEILEKISFKNCDESIKKIITIVATYMQESM